MTDVAYASAAVKVVAAKQTRIRWIVASLMWLAIAINYIDRTVLSAAAPHLIRELSIPVGRWG